jgi:signal transduction histidine kinase
MKLWQKIFLGAFLLFELVFTLASLYLVQYHFSTNLNKEIDRGLTEQRMIQSGLQTNGTYINEKLGFPQSVVRDFLRITFQEYTRYFDQKGVFIELLDDNRQMVYSSFNTSFVGTRGELEVQPSGLRNYVIRDIGEKSYLFVTSGLALEDDHFLLTYVRDITDVYTDKSAQVSLFLKLNAVTMLILGLGLYLLLWYLTRSIRSLTRSVQIIAEGDYSQHVHIQSKDEVGILARNFNRMAAAVEANIGELKRTAEDKQHFTECLTHELKTPLTSIIGYADLLRSTKYNEELHFNGLNYIYTESKRLESLSFKLMDLILLRKEELIGTREDARELCMEIAASFLPRLESVGLELVQQVESSYLTVDRDLFKVLCTNLLDNAIKASTEGGRIMLQGHAEGDGGYVLEIVDEGNGIPEEDLDKIFEPFYMVDRARSRSHQGAGLGLAICAEIVRLHGADIDIHSRLNQGTTVKLTWARVYN